MKLALKKNVKAAKELNEVLGLEPAIDVDADPTELKEQLLEAITLIDSQDTFSPQTEHVIDELAKLEPEPEPDNDPDLSEEVQNLRAALEALDGMEEFIKHDFEERHISIMERLIS